MLSYSDCQIIPPCLRTRGDLETVIIFGVAVNIAIPILATSQVFTRVAKPIREQTTMLYSPVTLLGCLTIVRKYKPTCNADGVPDSKKPCGIFFFVHNKELRESYDTYMKIEKMAKQGFKKEEERIYG